MYKTADVSNNVSFYSIEPLDFAPLISKVLSQPQARGQWWNWYIKAQNGQKVVLATSGLGFYMRVLDAHLLAEGPHKFLLMSGCTMDAQTF